MVVQIDTNGTFVAYISEIAGCHAWGETAEEARRELVNVFEMIQEENLAAPSIAVEGSDELIPSHEIAESETALQDYRAGLDRGIPATELKQLLENI